LTIKYKDVSILIDEETFQYWDVLSFVIEINRIGKDE